MDFETRRYSGNRRSSDFLVKVETTDNGTFQGHIDSIHTDQVQYFRSCLEMVLLIQQKLDERNFPQNSTEIRTWKDAAPVKR